jgi:Rv0078B-related antitoxin
VPDESPATRLRAALDLFEVGEAMLRCRLRRERPDADETEITAEINSWLHRRPGAEFGDFPGPASKRQLSTP